MKLRDYLLTYKGIPLPSPDSIQALEAKRNSLLLDYALEAWRTNSNLFVEVCTQEVTRY